MNSPLRVPALTLTISLLAFNAVNVVQAAEKSIEVKAGDTLSTIIAEHYPNYKTSKILTQAIFEANVASFKNQSVHQLIVGKTLLLPDPITIPNLQAPELKPETASTPNDDKELAKLKNQLKTLAAEKEQLAKELKDLATTASTATPSAETDAPDPAILMQQLDEIESANEQILADKNKLLTEQEELKKQLQTLEADKKQLETKLASQETSTVKNETASTSPEATATDALDPTILQQQLDEIESANEQILADKKQLEQERDQLKQQLQTLQAGQPTEVTASSPPVAATPDTAPANPDAPDPAILMQQLDEIEAANEQLITDKNKLQADLETAQQQLKERDQTMSALTGQVNETKAQLESSQKELLLANAARANAELNKASLEKQHGSWLPWLLALFMLPVGWLLGRHSKNLTMPTHETKQTTTNPPTVTPATVAATDTPIQASFTELSTASEFSPLAPSAAAQSVAAANDDNLDAAIKLDIVRAYLDLRDSTAASSLLKEVLREGGQRQQQEAREILSFLS